MASYAYDLAIAALRETPHRRMGESLHPDFMVRMRAHIANAPTNKPETVLRHNMLTHAAELLFAAEKLADVTPEHEKPKKTSVTTGGRSRADQATYMREYQRRRRAAEKAAKEAAQ
jgi:hypothetical protein